MINLIVDMDGCLINSTEVQRAALWGSYKEVVGDDKCPSFEEYIKYTGDSVENVLKKMNLPKEMAVYFKKISIESVDKVIINWELIRLFEEMKKNGSRFIIVTGKDHSRAQAILDYYNISGFFEGIVGADDVFNPKPSGEPMFKALEMLKGEINHTFSLGDGLYDILSAKEARIKSILALWYVENDVSYKADYIAHTVRELKDIIDDLSININE